VRSILETSKFEKCSSDEDLTKKVISCLPKLIGWCSDEKAEEIIDLILEEKPKVYVEIGVFGGSSLFPVLATFKYLKQGKVYAIDSWSNDVCIKNLDDTDPNKKWWEKVDLKQVHNSFKSMLKNYKMEKICKIFKCTSENALKNFEDNSIDVLHIDGNYSEETTYNDVVKYLPKVKKDGFIWLSNIYWYVNGEMPREKAFEYLFDNCSDLMLFVDNGNCVLFQK